jgi:hypothetical protein
MSKQVQLLLPVPGRGRLTGVCVTHLLEKCTCDAAAAAKKLQATSLPALQQPLLTMSSPLPPSPVASEPRLATVDSEERSTPVHALAASAKSSSPTDRLRELRRERDEETADGESAPKRRRITPTPAPMSSPAPAPATAHASSSSPVPGVVPSPGVAETQKAAEAVVPADKPPVLYPENAQQLGPAPGFVPPESVPAPEHPEDPNTATVAVAAAPRKIGIQHIQLVYETIGQTLQCRMCLYVVFFPSAIPASLKLTCRCRLRKREVDEDTRVATYPSSAAYAELVGHCEQEHEAALDALASMTPSEIAEMHQRMRMTR